VDIGGLFKVLLFTYFRLVPCGTTRYTKKAISKCTTYAKNWWRVTTEKL